ncbi:MAG: NAD(P)/FAD-dependent oxidoreductase [Anaerolineae bacterium]|nr:NAD(P)/FAD-dependent oxidoreductase [Anaerolineae bacterium]
MQSAYDVVVVGAGPAGSVAARKFADAGLRVLMIEKRQEIGAPVRCAEAVGSDTTRPYIDIDNRWIDATITHYAICSAAGDRVIVPPTELTYVVNRKVFDWELAHLASRAGAEVRTRTQATGLIIEGGQVVGVHMDSMGKSYTVRARLVVAADGTESQTARWAGLGTVPPMADYYVGFQYLLGNLGGRINPAVCEYHLGHALAPGGYVWVFPKGDDTANVGLVISANHAAEASAQHHLDEFVERVFPGAHILGVVAGGIPATGALKKMVTDGLMVVGDAAHQADPLTAGGINLGMIGADLAAQVGIRALANGGVSARNLRDYPRLWQERFGAQHSALYKIRKFLTEMDDEHLAQLIHTASTLPLRDMSNGEILFALLKHHPALMIQATTLVTTGLLLK